MIKRYPLTLILVISIWVLCFINVPDSPLSHISLIDKWTHILMYFVLTMCAGFEYTKANKQAKVSRLLLYTWLLPVVMGGLIEIMQANCTGGRRSGDWLDFYADAIGSTIAFLIGILLVRYRANR